MTTPPLTEEDVSWICDECGTKENLRGATLSIGPKHKCPIGPVAPSHEQGVTLAVDPGNTTGVAFIGASGALLYDAQMSHREFVEFLIYPPQAAVQLMRYVKLAVVEDFQLLPGKARAVSQKKSRSVDAARGIGAIDLWAQSRGIELIYRDPSHWRIGLQLAGIEPGRWPKQHKDGHAMCAYGAGFHALVEYGLVQSRLGSLQ